MTTLSVRGINDDLKKEFEKAVVDKYGKKHTVMGLEVQKALVFYLSGGKTVDFEELQDLENNGGVPPKKTSASLSPHKKHRGNSNLNMENDHGNLEMFAESFVNAYGTGSLVSKEVVRKHMIRTQGFSSDKALKNRINYMVAVGALEYGYRPGDFRISEIENENNLGF